MLDLGRLQNLTELVIKHHLYIPAGVLVLHFYDILEGSQKFISKLQTKNCLRSLVRLLLIDKPIYVRRQYDQRSTRQKSYPKRFFVHKKGRRTPFSPARS
jgi:hypothetical protein